MSFFLNWNEIFCANFPKWLSYCNQKWEQAENIKLVTGITADCRWHGEEWCQFSWVSMQFITDSNGLNAYLYLLFFCILLSFHFFKLWTVTCHQLSIDISFAILTSFTIQLGLSYSLSCLLLRYCSNGSDFNVKRTINNGSTFDSLFFYRFFTALVNSFFLLFHHLSNNEQWAMCTQAMKRFAWKWWMKCNRIK